MRQILEQPVCGRCVLRFRRNPKPCPGCGQLKVLVFYDATRRPCCAACTGNDPVYACIGCGSEDNTLGRTCAPCALRGKLTELLADPTGVIHPRLQPVFDAFMAGPRPQSTLYWLTRHGSRPDILRSMARGELEISHAAFVDLPSNRAVNYVRDLLVALGVLPPYDAPVERIIPWLQGVLQRTPKPHAEVIKRFANWYVLRRLRAARRTGTPTQKAAERARAEILAATRFLGWLTDRTTLLGAATQPDLEFYLAEHPGQAATLTAFLDWTNRSRLTSDLRIPPRAQPYPQVVLSDEQRWRHVELLLHDDTIRLYARISGLFLLLFAQPLARICRMRAEQITRHPDGQVTVTFDTVPIELPDPLDQLVLQHLTRRGQASYASRPDKWLFPGGIPGRHLVTENIRAELVAHGIHPSHARKAAMFQLAAEIPAPVLADLLDLTPKTATRWATLAARDWSHYAAMRRAEA
jgi:hypothetical protein